MGIASGALLVLTLSGGNYHVGQGELLSFIVMSILATAIKRAVLGGAIRFVTGLFLYRLRSWAGSK